MRIERLNITDYKNAENDTALLKTAVEDVVNKAKEAQQNNDDVTYVLDLENREYRIDSPITIKSVSNIVIDGHGAFIIMTAEDTVCNIFDSSIITLKNLSVDYDPLNFTQGVIYERGEDYLIVDIDEGYSVDVDRLNSKKFRSGAIYGSVHDRETGELLSDYQEHLWLKDAVLVGPRRIKMTETGRQKIAKPHMPGDVVSLAPFGCNTFNINGCDTVTLEYVNIYNGGTSALRVSGGRGNHHFLHVNVIPGPKPAGAKYPRLRSVGGDILHAACQKVGPTIDHCTFTFSGDDNINIHGFFFHVLEVNGKVITLSPKFNTPWSVGEEVEIYDGPTYDSKGTAKITKFTVRPDSSYKERILEIYKYIYHGCSCLETVFDIELDREVDIKPGDHITSIDGIGSKAVIRNSHFGFSRAHGILARAKDVVIENNTFTNLSNTAIGVLASAAWCEAGFANGMVIRNNVIKDTSVCINGSHSSEIGAINVTIQPENNHPGGLFKNYEMRKMTIEGNTIINSRRYGISVTNAKDLVIKDNNIVDCFYREVGNVGQKYSISPSSGILVAMSKNVTVTGNTVSACQDEITTPVDIHETCIGDIVCKNNKMA